MAFVKVVKNKPYFKRFQVKYRRRREGKTDYYARTRLIIQDKNKYNTPKYRFVVRFSNQNVVCQIVEAKIDGDNTVCSATSAELHRFGLPAALTLKNYAAAYATGLLVARRLLKKLKLDEAYKGKVQVDGESYLVEENGERRPFKALLDVGLKRTTTGSRIFAAVKGACDGGLLIPHNERRFPKYDRSENKHDPELLKSFIFGGHVADYMRDLKENDGEMYRAKFALYLKAGIDADKIEGMWKKIHSAIRANPDAVKKEKKLSAAQIKDSKKWANVKRLTNDTKRANLQKRLEIRAKARAEGQDV